MIIEFPKKYSVRKSASTRFSFDVEMPKEYTEAAVTLFKQQPWVRLAHTSNYEITGSIWVFVSLAYEITEAQAIEALSTLCESIIAPPVEIDAGLAGELEELL